MYLAWFDANPKKPIAQKIAEAHQRFVEKFNRQPLVCLINPNDMVAESPIELRPLQYIGRNCFWIGIDESMEQTPEVPAARTPRAKQPKVAPAPVPAPVPKPVVAPAAKRRTRREKVAA